MHRSWVTGYGVAWAIRWVTSESASYIFNTFLDELMYKYSHLYVQQNPPGVRPRVSYWGRQPDKYNDRCISLGNLRTDNRPDLWGLETTKLSSWAPQAHPKRSVQIDNRTDGWFRLLIVRPSDTLVGETDWSLNSIRTTVVELKIEYRMWE